jgi:Ribbon-helix-helix protein, copG family.
MDKISFRADDELVEYLEEYSEETGSSKSEIMRSHLISLKEDPLYREFHKGNMDGSYDDLADFLESDQDVDSDWVNLEKVDYDEMFDRFKKIKHAAERGELDEAYQMVDDLRDDGYEREEILMQSIVAKYDE